MESIFDRKTKNQKYLLSSFQANIIGGGGPDQKLHVDIPVPEPLPSWILKANIIFPIDDFTELVSFIASKILAVPKTFVAIVFLLS